MDYTKGMISCIIPMYNARAYIERCIKSVCNQTYNNVEIIVVDDGSTDSSREIVKNMCPAYVELIEKDNGGVSSARNAGLEKAQGEYVFFLDADDYLPLNAFSTLVNQIECYEADIVIGRDLCFSEGAQQPEEIYGGKVSLWEDEQTLIKALSDFPNTWNVCGKIFRRSILASKRFVEGKVVGEDSYYFFQCALEKPKTVYIEQTVYFVSMREGSATRSPISKKKIDDILYFVECKKRDIYEQFNEYNALVYNLEIKAHLLIAHMLLRTSEYKEYEKKSLQLIRLKRKYYIPGQSNDQLFRSIVHYYYWIYKIVFQIVKRNSIWRQKKK